MDSPEISNAEAPVVEPSPLLEHKVRIEQRLSRTLAVLGLTEEQQRDFLTDVDLLRLGIFLRISAAVIHFGKEFVEKSDAILNRAEDLPKE